MRTIRASDINVYHFCQRAWKYAQLGEESENQAEMAAGNKIHYQHGRAVMGASCLRIVAYGLLLLALALLAFYLTRMLF
jgi:hypothetical protein